MCINRKLKENHARLGIIAETLVETHSRMERKLEDGSVSCTQIAIQDLKNARKKISF
jgi:hypothetical protein